MAAPNWQANGSIAHNAGAITVPWPASHAVDDIAILVVETANQAVTLSTPAGFVQVTNSPQGTGTAGGTSATRLSVFWCRATSTTMASPVVADSGDHQFGQIITFRGCKTSGDPWNVTAGDVLASASTTVTVPGATTTVADCLVVAICSHGIDIGTGNQFTSWANASLSSITERTDQSGTSGNGGGVGTASGVKAAAGAYNASTATLASSFVQGRMSIALAPATTAYTLVAEAGSYAASGIAAGLLLGHVLAAAAGSYAVTGTDAGTFKGSAIIAEAGAYAVTGSEATLTYTPGSNHLLVADPGSYGITGTAAGTLLGRKVAAEAGSYATTGTDAALLANHKVVADAGSYAQTGTDASLERGYAVAAGAGSYLVTGQDAQLVYEPNNAYVIGAAPGAYAATGTDATLLKGSRVAADAGAYVVTGASAAFAIAKIPTAIAVHSLTVSMPAPHRLSVSFFYRHGTSIMDTWTLDNDSDTIDNDHGTLDDAPMRYR